MEPLIPIFIVAAILLIPLIWHSPMGLALGMAGYLALGWLCARSSVVWCKTEEREIDRDGR